VPSAILVASESRGGMDSNPIQAMSGPASTAAASARPREISHHTVRFSTAYYTTWGERVVIVGSHPVLGGNALQRAFPMTCRPQFGDGGHVRDADSAKAKQPRSAGGTSEVVGLDGGSPSQAQTVTVLSALNHTLPARNATKSQPPSSLMWDAVVEVPVGVTEVVFRLAIVREDEEATRTPSSPTSPTSSSLPSSLPPSPSSRHGPWTLVKYARDEHVLRFGRGRGGGADMEPLQVVVCCAWVDMSHPGCVLGAAAFAGVFCGSTRGDRSNTISNTISNTSGNAGGDLGAAVPSVHVTLEVMDLELEEVKASNTTYSLCVTGGNKALGNWQPKQVRDDGRGVAWHSFFPTLMIWSTGSPARALARSLTPSHTRSITLQVVWMDKVKPGLWRLELDIPASGFPITYKYAIGVRDADDGGTSPHAELILEPGENRLLVAPGAEHHGASTGRANHHYYAFDGFLRRQERWRAAGIALPVFSIRHNASSLCGQFTDLPVLGRWCKACGFSLLQLLPVCDTSVRNTWRDSYPYSSLCVFALHPMYLDVRELMGGDEFPSCANGISSSPRSGRGDVDYEATMAFKLAAARRAFDKHGERELKSPDYQTFERENSHWLLHYAVFCFLRDFFRTAEHWTWGVYSKPTAERYGPLLPGWYTWLTCRHPADDPRMYVHVYLASLCASPLASPRLTLPCASSLTN
jgi:hypothetical protein